VVRVSQVVARIYGRGVTNLSSVGVESMDDLLADCGSMPAALRTSTPKLPLPRLAASWTVSDANVAAVHDLDEYV
jgi:hypothetical protein